MPRVIYRGGKALVKVSKSDRKIGKKYGVKFPRKTIISVDQYAKILERIEKKRRKN